MPVVSLDEARGAALRRRRRHLVGDRVLALRAARRALRLVRAEPRGPLLPARRARAPRRALVLDLPVVVHHRGALDRRHARGPAPRARRASSCATGSTRTSSRPPAALEPRVDGPLRILVEGNANVWFKGVDEAVAAVGQMQRAARRHGRRRPTATASWPAAPTASSGRSRSARWPSCTPTRRAAQALARRGHVRAAAGGLPHGRDVRDDRGHRPRGVRRARRQRARRATGTTRAARRASSTCSPATACCCTGCASTRWTPRARGRRGSRPAQFMAGALHAIRREPRPTRPPRSRRLMADVRAGIEEQR